MAGALKGVIVAVLGLAELVEEEDDGLQAQDQHDSPDEARGVKRVLVRLARGDDCRGAGVGRSCGSQRDKINGMELFWRIGGRTACVQLRHLRVVGTETVELVELALVGATVVTVTFAVEHA